MTPGELLQISTSGQNCSKFGIHASLPFLKELYDVGEASFITNIGGLVQPTTMETYRGGAQRCFGLFSHNDQTNALRRFSANSWEQVPWAWAVVSLMPCQRGHTKC